MNDLLDYYFNKTEKINKLTIKKIVYFIARIWQIHPFSDGNTRVFTVFMIQCFRNFGFDYLEFEDITYEIRDVFVLYSIGDKKMLKKIIKDLEKIK